uniref:Uncharacterized protein n=1 Tax=Leersia perrieri TaxID=77586 RepID=A0A0D9VK85_9ORYZ
MGAATATQWRCFGGIHRRGKQTQGGGGRRSEEPTAMGMSVGRRQRTRTPEWEGDDHEMVAAGAGTGQRRMRTPPCAFVRRQLQATPLSVAISTSKRLRTPHAFVHHHLHLQAPVSLLMPPLARGRFRCGRAHAAAAPVAIEDGPASTAAVDHQRYGRRRRRLRLVVPSSAADIASVS